MTVLGSQLVGPDSQGWGKGRSGAAGVLVTVPSGGLVLDSLYAYLQGPYGGGQAILAVYSAAGALLAHVQVWVPASPGWVSANLSSPPTLAAGNYVLAVIGGSGPGWGGYFWYTNRAGGRWADLSGADLLETPVSFAASFISPSIYGACSSASPAFAVGGTAALGAAPLAGVLVSDGTRSTTTDVTGAFSLANVPPGTYSLSARLAGYTFAPQTIVVSSANVTGVEFAATVPGGGGGGGTGGEGRVRIVLQDDAGNTLATVDQPTAASWSLKALGGCDVASATFPALAMPQRPGQMEIWVDGARRWAGLVKSYRLEQFMVECAGVGFRRRVRDLGPQRRGYRTDSPTVNGAMTAGAITREILNQAAAQFGGTVRVDVTDDVPLWGWSSQGTLDGELDALAQIAGAAWGCDENREWYFATPPADVLAEIDWQGVVGATLETHTDDLRNILRAWGGPTDLADTNYWPADMSTPHNAPGWAMRWPNDTSDADKLIWYFGLLEGLVITQEDAGHLGEYASTGAADTSYNGTWKSGSAYNGVNNGIYNGENFYQLGSSGPYMWYDATTGIWQMGTALPTAGTTPSPAYQFAPAEDALTDPAGQWTLPDGVTTTGAPAVTQTVAPTLPAVITLGATDYEDLATIGLTLQALDLGDGTAWSTLRPESQILHFGDDWHLNANPVVTTGERDLRIMTQGTGNPTVAETLVFQVRLRLPAGVTAAATVQTCWHLQLDRADGTVTTTHNAQDATLEPGANGEPGPWQTLSSSVVGTQDQGFVLPVFSLANADGAESDVLVELSAFQVNRYNGDDVPAYVPGNVCWRVFYADDARNLAALGLPVEAQASAATFGPILAEESAMISHQGKTGVDYQGLAAFGGSYLKYYAVPYTDGAVPLPWHLPFRPWAGCLRLNNLPIEVRRYYTEGDPNNPTPELPGVLAVGSAEYTLSPAGVSTTLQVVNPGRLIPVTAQGWARNLPPDLVSNNAALPQKRPNFWSILGSLALNVALAEVGGPIASTLGGSLGRVFSSFLK
jgi:hypothetical protein